MKILAERLKLKRIDNNHSQQQIADILNIKQATYNGYERNAHEPSLDTLIKIADIYNTSIDWLLGRYK